jgi:hypothetical protein
VIYLRTVSLCPEVHTLMWRSANHYAATTCTILSRQFCGEVLICKVLHHLKLGRTLRCFVSQQ